LTKFWLGTARTAFAEDKEIRIDYAAYNPLSLVLKRQGLFENAFAPEGYTIRVQRLGSSKVLEFLNAGAEALIGRVNGNPIKAIYVYSCCFSMPMAVSHFWRCSIGRRLRSNIDRWLRACQRRYQCE